MAKHTHDHADCSLSTSEADDLVAATIEELREMGFRRTDALVDLLRAMTLQHQPYTLAELAELPGLRDRDQATVYRLIMKLKDVGKVRQLNLAGRVNHFQLVLPGHHHDYLLCESCGTVAEVPMKCQLAEMERQIMAKFGWKCLHHELEFFGICPACVVD
ncbi:MAG: Fe2+ or Zn2+ uptake regulation protein [Verrucomicrobiales bacterium]|jgi:Fe2+ or Zn2+ uptake regulation protein